MGRQASKIGRVEVVQIGAGRGQQGVQEALVGGLVQGAVDEIGVALAVAGGPEGDGHVDGVRFHDGRDGVVEEEALAAAGPGKPVRQRFRGEGARGEEGGHRRVRGLDQRQASSGCWDASAERVGDGSGRRPPDPRPGSSRPAPGSPRRSAGSGNPGARSSAFRMPVALIGIITLEGIGADHLRRVARAGGPGSGVPGASLELHLVAPLGQLPGGFGARQSCTDDCDIQCPSSSAAARSMEWWRHSIHAVLQERAGSWNRCIFT